MTLRRLVVKEMLHRKLNSAMALLSVIAAVACLVGALTMLRAHDLRTNEIIAQKEAETEETMLQMEDDYRKIMKKLGFNLLIIPSEQEVGDLYADDYASKYMPEEYVDRLVEARIMSIRHLLPSLQQKLKWPERQRTIILMGVRGEVPLPYRDRKEPLLEPVPSGGMVVGYELHRSLGLSVGDRVELLGREFTVNKLHPERGNKDDITVWIGLAEAQELLGRRGKINAILALECFCFEPRLAEIREEVSRILPDTQVIEFATEVLVRAEARGRAAQTAREALAREKRSRADHRAEIETFASVLVPLVVVVCALWIGLLAFGNVRQRRPEIGILHALGLRSRDILIVFLAKALLIGALGAVIGYVAGLVAGGVWGELPLGRPWWAALFDWRLLVAVVVLAPLLSAFASWIPAMVAAQQDPALVLREE